MGKTGSAHVRALRRVGALVATGLLVAVAAPAALAPAPAPADTCSGSLSPGPGAGNDISYSFTCDFGFSTYKFGASQPGTPHDLGQGFEVCMNGSGAETPDAGPDKVWNCGGGDAGFGAPATGSFLLAGACISPFTIRVMADLVPKVISLGMTCPPAGGGTGSGAPPKITALAVSPSAFRAASRGGSVARAVGATVRYTLSQPARATFAVERAVTGIKSRGRCVAPTRRNRNGRKCTRYVTLRGSFALDGVAGDNRFRFTGRLGGRKLAPASYRFAVAARDAAARTGSAVRSPRFRILR